MLLSVIIPVYNAAPFVRECLASIRPLLPDDSEVVCIDDGSTDDSCRILSEFAERDSRIKVIRQENKGQGAARNRGLLAAHGAFVYFADADDALTGVCPFARLIDEMTRDELDVLFFDAETRFDQPRPPAETTALSNYYIRRHGYPGVFTGADLFARFIANREFVVSPPLMLLRRAFLSERRLLFPEGCYYEDNVFVQHVMLAARRPPIVPWRFYLRKVHEGSTVTQKPTLRHLRGRILCCQDALALLRQDVGQDKARAGLRERLRIHRHYLRRLVREHPDLIAHGWDRLSDDERTLVRSVETYPLRDKLADVIQCLGDRGLVYTVRRILLGRKALS